MNTSKLRELLMNENGFAFDQSTGHTYNITPVGVEIIGWMKHGSDEARVLQQLIAEYDVDAATAKHDLESFLGSLQRYGLIAPHRETSA